MKKNKQFTEIKPFTDIKFDSWGDYDKDYWPNWADCRPKNPKLQHVRPSQTTRKRLEKLPIFFVTGDTEAEKRKYYGYKKEVYTRKGKSKVKKVPKEIRQTQQRFYSVIKRRPDVIGEIERKKPAAVIVTSKGGETQKGYATYTEKTKDDTQHRVVVQLSGERGRRYDREDVEEGAGTFIHELEHVRQMKAWEGKPKLIKKMQKGRYSKRREEVLARKAEEKASRKRYTWPYAKKESITESQKRFDEIEERENDKE